MCEPSEPPPGAAFTSDDWAVFDLAPTKGWQEGEYCPRCGTIQWFPRDYGGLVRQRMWFSWWWHKATCRGRRAEGTEE